MNYQLIKAILMAIGGMVGGGIFLLNGFNIYKLGSKSIYSWLFGSLIALIFSFSFIILNIKYHGSSGTIDFSDHLIKNINSKSIVILLIILAYVCITSVYTLSLSEYIGKFINFQKLKIIGIFVIIICMILNYYSKQIFEKIIVGLVLFKLLLLFFIIIFGILKPIQTLTNQITDIRPISFPNNSLLFVILFYSISCFLSYEGFEFIANSSKKIPNKQFSIPISYMASIIIVGIIYIGLSFVTHKHTYNLLNEKNYFSSLYLLIKQYGFNTFGPILILFIVLVANISAINATYFAVDTFFRKLLKNTNFKFLKYLSKKIKIPFFKKKRSLYLYIFSLLIICFLFLPNLFLTNLSSLLFILFFGYISFLGYLETLDSQKNKRKILIFKKRIPYTICYFIQFVSIIISLLSLFFLGKNMIINK